MKLFSLLLNICTQQTLKAHYLFSKPRRSLYRLQLKFVQTTAEVSKKYYVLTNLSTRTYHCKYVVLVSAKSPARAILLQSPGRKPWINRRNTFIEPQRDGTTLSRTNARTESAAPSELNPLLSKVYPGFHFGLCPHYTLGYAGVSCLKALVISPNFDALALGYAGVPCLKALVISRNPENNAASATQCNGIN